MSEESKERIEAQCRLIMEMNLGARVLQQDVNAGSSTYDARVEYPDGRLAAAEFSAIEDSKLMQRNAQLERIGPEMECAQLRFSLRVHFLNDAPIGSSLKARKSLCRALSEMEEHVSAPPRFRTLQLSSNALELGIAQVDLVPEGPAGKVHLFPGWTSNGLAASDVPQWISTLFQEEAQQDNVRKLQESGMDENHMLWIARDGTPDMIALLLEDPEGNLPQEAPNLPDGVTDVWLVGGFASQGGWRWNTQSGWLTLELTTSHICRPDV